MPTMPMRAKTAAEPQATDWKKPAKSWAKSMIGLWRQRGAEATLLKASSVGYQRVSGLRGSIPGVRRSGSRRTSASYGFCSRWAEGVGGLSSEKWAAAGAPLFQFVKICRRIVDGVTSERIF